MPKPKGWPTEYEADYQQFIVEFETIKEISARLIVMGAEGNSFPYLRRAMPTLGHLAREISRHVIDLERRRRSPKAALKRWPYKIPDLISQMDMTAGHLAKLADSAYSFISLGNGPVVEQKVKAISDAVNEILTEMARHRVAFDLDGDPAGEAAEIVNKLTESWPKPKVR